MNRIRTILLAAVVTLTAVSAEAQLQRAIDSISTVAGNGTAVLQDHSPTVRHAMSDEYPKSGKTLYLNIIWHQHQPLYVDPGSDQLQGPWVRTHGTKDYYDMASMLERYPNIHCTVNLTMSLLVQLQQYYVDRIEPFIDYRKNRIDAKAYFKKWYGKTDPWIDIALKSTASLDSTDTRFLLYNVWNAFGVSEVIIGRFPEYRGLREKFRTKGGGSLSEQELREIKFWFYAACFDPDFLEGAVKLKTGRTVDVTDLIECHPDTTYTLRKSVTDDDCNRIVTETVKILAAVVPVHKKLMYKPSTHAGQIEILTTPYTHPILPLIYDSDLAKLCQPNDPMPNRFHYPKDAEAQVAKAVHAYRQIFGVKPNGMWPGEGSVALDVLPVFSHQGISWVATDQKILERSKPDGQPCYYPYAVTPAGNGGPAKPVVVVFRETELSDKIGFVYQNYGGEDAADDFVRNVLRYVPRAEEPDRLLTVILDGENAWEWYRFDNDGKGFQNALYRKLSRLHETGQVITSTVTEYISGNPSRSIPPHPVEGLPKLEWLWPGSWINANYDTWIGEDEENRAWNMLLKTRQDLEASAIPQPHPEAEIPKAKTKAWYGYRAWEAMYAAEGSDWFWWYGTDQEAPGGDKPFDIAFITHIRNVYTFAEQAGAKMPKRDIQPIIRNAADLVSRPSQGTMAQSRDDLVTVLFQCDAKDIYVRKSLFIAGNHSELGNWVPNSVRLYDDGSHGDVTAGDSIWTLEVKLPLGVEIEYKFTNSGAEGNWNPGEEFPGANRKIKIVKDPAGKMVVRDRFGKM